MGNGNYNYNYNDKVALFPEKTPAEEADEVDGAKAWRQTVCRPPEIL